MKSDRSYPRFTVSAKGTRWVESGHPWIYEGEIVAAEDCPNGSLVDAVSEKGKYLGTGFLSRNSKIRIRLLSRNANDRFDAAFWARKLEWAWAHRKACMGTRALPGCEPDTNCCRVIFSEADGFPGLTVDRYEDVLVSQVTTFGMDHLRNVIYPLLLQVFAADGQQIRGIYERNDGTSRKLEGLPQYKGWWRGADGTAEVPESARVIARENGIAFDLDLENSQKTGFFLDQKYNRRAVRQLARGRRVLDCFCHVGPFGLNAAAGGADFVRCVDVSQTAIDLAHANAQLNGLELADDGTPRMGFTAANVLEYLPQLRRDRAYLRQEGGPFDLIVLDPPAFTKSRSTVDHALKGYREINQAAMQLLPRGGYLATCSCSQHMTTELLSRAIAEAAHNANVQLKQVEQRQQAPDHPVLWGVPETHYLDFFTFQVV